MIHNNYPPGFNGKFPWDDDMCFLDYDNAFESTLEFLRQNPDEYRPKAKELFLAMGGTLRTQDDWEDFSYLKSDIQKAIKAFDDENTINECNNMKKKVIRLTESEFKSIITESIKKILKEQHPYPNWVYIVCDGSSCYGIYACDLDEELENGAEILKGPFRNWDDKVDGLIEQYNDQLNGTSMYR